MWCAHFFESEKAMESNEVATSTALLAKTTGIVEENVKKPFLMFCHQKPQLC